MVLVEEVAWSDASLGCPQPGMSYAQVITDGMRIILQAEDALFDYRSGGTSEPFRCVQAVISEKGSPGVYEITEDGSVIVVVPPSGEGRSSYRGQQPARQVGPSPSLGRRAGRPKAPRSISFRCWLATAVDARPRSSPSGRRHPCARPHRGTSVPSASPAPADVDRLRSATDGRSRRAVDRQGCHRRPGAPPSSAACTAAVVRHRPAVDDHGVGVVGRKRQLDQLVGTAVGARRR